jgi:spermidine/putrescine transport system ATP-binding protein
MANLLPATVEAVNQDGATARLADGSIVQGGAVEGLAAGDAATFMIRPERMHLQVGGDAGLAAEVTDLVFQGPLVRVEVRAADGSMLVAHIGPDAGLPMLMPGTAVRVVWDEGGGRVLRRTERVATKVDDPVDVPA